MQEEPYNIMIFTAVQMSACLTIATSVRIHKKYTVCLKGVKPTKQCPCPMHPQTLLKPNPMNIAISNPNSALLKDTNQSSPKKYQNALSPFTTLSFTKTNSLSTKATPQPRQSSPPISAQRPYSPGSPSRPAGARCSSCSSSCC